MLEKDLEAKLVNSVKDLGGKAYKFVSPGNAGVPDRIVVLPGNKIRFCRNEEKSIRRTNKITKSTD